MDSDFDNVTWSTESDSQPERTDTREQLSSPGLNGNQQPNLPPARPMADPVDLGGIGSGYLECEVGSPLKENDGSKDAYVSYQVTTHVCPQLALCMPRASRLTSLDRLQILPKIHPYCPPTLHRLRLPLQEPLARLPRMRCTTTARQAANGIRKGRSVRSRFHTATRTLPFPLPEAHYPAPHPPTQFFTGCLPREPRLECAHASPPRRRRPHKQRSRGVQ